MSSNHARQPKGILSQLLEGAGEEPNPTTPNGAATRYVKTHVVPSGPNAATPGIACQDLYARYCNWLSNHDWPAKEKDLFTPVDAVQFGECVKRVYSTIECGQSGPLGQWYYTNLKFTDEELPGREFSEEDIDKCTEEGGLTGDAGCQEEATVTGQQGRTHQKKDLQTANDMLQANLEQETRRADILERDNQSLRQQLDLRGQQLSVARNEIEAHRQAIRRWRKAEEGQYQRLAEARKIARMLHRKVLSAGPMDEHFWGDHQADATEGDVDRRAS